MQGEVEPEGPSESECRPYIEKALKDLEHGEVAAESSEAQDSVEDVPTVEVTDDSSRQEGEGDENETYDDKDQDSKESVEEENLVEAKVAEQKTEPEVRMTVIQKIMLGLSSFFKKTTDKSKEAAIEDKVTDDKVLLLEIDSSHTFNLDIFVEAL